MQVLLLLLLLLRVLNKRLSGPAGLLDSPVDIHHYSSRHCGVVAVCVCVCYSGYLFVSRR